jgi:DNA-binding NarL/FixJ family response regulator
MVLGRIEIGDALHASAKEAKSAMPPEQRSAPVNCSAKMRPSASVMEEHAFLLMEGRARVVVVDDQPLFREGFLLLLAKLARSVEVNGVGTCEEALELIEARGMPDLALVELKPPGMSGFEGLKVLSSRYPDLPVVVLSSEDDPGLVMRAIDLGAMGFIPKSSRVEQMLAALRLVLAKEIYLPATVLVSEEGRTALPAVRQVSAATAPAKVGTGRTPDDLGLTPRQSEVLYLILQGKAVKSIARDLALSPATVKSHTSAVLRALNVTTRTQAIIAASRLGIKCS